MKSIKKFSIIFIASIVIIAVFNSFAYHISSNQIHEYLTRSIEEMPQSSNAVTNWTLDGNAICISDNLQENQQICSDEDGGAIIVWQDFRNGSQYDIYAQRIDAYGNIKWIPNGLPICTNEYDQINPQICSDRAGGAIITWQDERGLSGTRYDIYVQRVNLFGAIEWTFNGKPICTKNNEKYDPQICANVTEGAIITWESAVNNEIYAQAIDLDGNVQWANNGELIAQYLNTGGNPQIISDEAGGAIITWERRDAGEYNIYAQRINSTGGIEWTPNGVPICTEIEYQMNPQICSDGAGGAIITWEDDRDKDFLSFGKDIYAQRIDANGIINWTSDGVGACRANENQIDPQICSDGSEGAYIVWWDMRTQVGDIYIQRIYSNGVRRWGTGGLAICDEDEPQGSPQICSDNSGGAIVTYNGYEEFYSDNIFVQRIDSDGDLRFSQYLDSIGWTTDNIHVCKASGDQVTPQICSDVSGGAVIVWKHGGLNADIYAKRMRSALPTSDNYYNAEIETSIADTNKLWWELYDDFGGGNYRILVENPNETNYIWINWTPWISNTNLEVPINRTKLGVFLYTMEFYDNHNQYGYPVSFTVKVVTPQEEPPPDDNGDDDGDGNGDNNGISGVPGYNIFILVCVISISSVILTKKWWKQ